MMYELINPSDNYQFEATDDRVATIAVAFISDKFMARRDGFEMPPLFVLSDEQLNGWVKDTFDTDLESLVKEVRFDRKDELIAALQSMTIDLPTYQYIVNENLPSDVEAFAAKWHDEHRSSMNDIRARALELAEAMQ